MERKRLRKRIPFIVTVIINIFLIIAVIFLMNNVQKRLYSDVKINLTEVVTQNKDVITSKLRMEMNNLGVIASRIGDQIEDNGGINNLDLKNILNSYVGEDSTDDQLFIADKNGTAYFIDGSKTAITGRQYFQLASQGTQNISERIVSRHTGEEIFVISVPVFVGEKIVGTLQRPYSPEKMYELCAISLFSSQGAMYIINGEGYIMISSNSEDYNAESGNYFRMLYAQGNHEQSKKLEADIGANKEGFMETEANGERLFSAYTSVDDIFDWYLVSSIANNAVSPNSNMVIKIFYLILFVVVFAFGASMFYFLSRKNREKANLERVAFVDSLTKGNTFTKFSVELSEVLKSPARKEYYLLAFDIENFKYINSFYGFDFGDKVLKSIYHDVSSKLRPGEIVARISGDNFIALLSDGSKERLNDLLKLSRFEEDVTIYIAAGLYKITNTSEGINLMVDKASTAAQSSKGLVNKDVVTYSEEFDHAMMQNEQMKRRMEKALKNGEIIPFYQPKVDVDTGELVGAEALARWITPEGEMISPADFIPLCEKTGLITELDMSIFDQTLSFLRKNLQQGNRCVPISVNFSRLHLINDGFIHQIVDKLSKHQVPENLIQIELTESVVIGNHEMIMNLVNHLHDHKLQICIDDFGSGYSSLNMLKDIPIDILKIDQGFLEGSNENERKSVILSMIVQMANKLHTAIVMEGVETEENVQMMKELGCQVAQGFYYAKPMHEESFAKVFKEGKVK